MSDVINITFGDNQPIEVAFDDGLSLSLSFAAELVLPITFSDVLPLQISFVAPVGGLPVGGVLGEVLASDGGGGILWEGKLEHPSLTIDGGLI